MNLHANFNDLKLLFDCACSEDDDRGVLVEIGFGAAKQRLLQGGLIEENPQLLGLVRITRSGIQLADRLLEEAKRGTK